TRPSRTHSPCVTNTRSIRPEVMAPTRQVPLSARIILPGTCSTSDAVVCSIGLDSMTPLCWSTGITIPVFVVDSFGAVFSPEFDVPLLLQPTDNVAQRRAAVPRIFVFVVLLPLRVQG